MIAFETNPHVRPYEWICCFCLHVRTGTILLGIWHLILHMLALGILATTVRYPKLLAEWRHDAASAASDASDASDSWESSPTPFSDEEIDARDHSLIYHELDVSSLVTACTMTVTVMLMYGAWRGKPAYLLPFFCLQLFDFSITAMTVTGHVFYIHSIHRLIMEAKQVPWRDELLELPDSVLVPIVIIGFSAALLIKFYCIDIVWRCYKFLTMRSEILNLTPYVISEARNSILTPTPPTSGVPAMPDNSSLLPDYDEAVKENSPPSYRAATLMTSDPANAANPTQGKKQQNQPLATNTVVMLAPQGEQVRV